MTDNNYKPKDGYTIEEFIDLVQTELTIACSLPKTLPDASIRQIIETRALPWFYRKYQYSVQNFYYLIKKEAFKIDEKTKFLYVDLPCEIRSIIYLYEVRNVTLIQLGINSPNLSLNMGVTNQPYLSSYVTTIGELGVYKVIIDSLADVLNQLSKFTLKFDFNYLTHRLHILTNVRYDVIIEAYANIPAEHLFKDDLFFKYVVGYSKVQLGNMLSRYDFSLPGGVKIQGNDLITQGKEEIKEVEDEINNQSNAAWFYMVRR